MQAALHHRDADSHSLVEQGARQGSKREGKKKQNGVSPKAKELELRYAAQAANPSNVVFQVEKRNEDC